MNDTVVYNILFGGLIVLSLIESATTWIILKKKRTKEFNPIFRWVILKLGLDNAMIMKLWCTVIIFWGLWSYHSSRVLVFAGLPLLAVVVNNIIVGIRVMRRN